MRTLIILNGECESLSYLKELSENFDRIICADGGYKHAELAGVIPDVVVGDFDSTKIPDGHKTVIFPKEKDVNDAEIALQYAIENFGGEIVLTCALGKRVDHQMFNIFLLVKYNNLSIEEKSVTVRFCDSNMEFYDCFGKTISFLPAVNSNITLSGFKYPLVNRDISLGESLTLSNVALDKAELYVNSGRVIAFINKNKI